MTQRTAIGTIAIALSIIAIIVVSAIGYLVVANQPNTGSTTSTTSTVCVVPDEGDGYIPAHRFGFNSTTSLRHLCRGANDGQLVFRLYTPAPPLTPPTRPDGSPLMSITSNPTTTSRHRCLIRGEVTTSVSLRDPGNIRSPRCSYRRGTSPLWFACQSTDRLPSVAPDGIQQHQSRPHRASPLQRACQNLNLPIRPFFPPNSLPNQSDH